MAQSIHNDSDQTHHAHEHTGIAHNHEHDLMQTDQVARQLKLVSGQGEFIFSYDKELTAAFPKDAHEFEAGMHGGFTEDPETGIPGYGLCSISSDLTKWNILGRDERLKDNIHGIVFFIHKGVKHLAVAQEGKRVLILTLDGTIVSEILKPTGAEFKFREANEFFSSEDSNFGVTDVTYLKGTIICSSWLFQR